MMTSGGLAPCLSASIASLTKFWIKAYREGEITGLTLRMYKDGYKGVLTGDSFVIPEKDWDRLVHLEDLGGSPIGNSRVKLTNVEDCVKRGYVEEGGDPLEVAAQQMLKDKVDVLHTIGGDDTNTQAAVLSKYLCKSCCLFLLLFHHCILDSRTIIRLSDVSKSIFVFLPLSLSLFLTSPVPIQ